MNRKFSLFLIVSFLNVQMFSTLHMAECGLEKHEHNGQVCDIYLHWEHTKYSTQGSAVTLQTPEYPTFAIALTELVFVRSDSYGVASPRAPPLFS